MIESLYFPLIVLASVVGFCTALFAFIYRDRTGAKPLAVFAAVASLWALTEALSVAQSGVETMAFWRGLALALSALIAPAWLLFALQYTGNERRRTRGLLALLLVEPLVFWGLLATNTEHELVWSGETAVSYGALDALVIEFGLAFWAHQAYSYLLIAAGAAVLLRMLLRTNRLYRWQGTALLVAITLPLSMNAAYSFGLLPPGLDPTGVALVLGALVLTVTVFETELAGVAPATRDVGREAALTELDDAVLILDDDGRLVDANPAAERLLGASVETVLGSRLETISAPLSRTLADAGDQAQFERGDGGGIRYYDVQSSSLYRGYGLISGRVVSLRDITERRQREQRLDVLNRLLRHNIRNELNLVRGKIELATATIENEDATAHLGDATDAIDDIVDRSDKLGRLSRMLDSGEREQIDIAAELRGKRAVGGFQPDEGTLSLELPDELFVTGGSALVAVFEELVENAIEHNTSDEPSVVIRLQNSDDQFAVIEVSDNGPGIEQQELATIQSGRETALQHSSGVGIWLVNWVVQRAGGTVSFENDDGCTVTLRLPRPE